MKYEKSHAFGTSLAIAFFMVFGNSKFLFGACLGTFIGAAII